MTSKSHILITGTNGFVGRHLYEALLASGMRVSGVVRASSLVANGGENRHILDLTDRAKTDAMFSALQPDIVIHLAGLKSRENDMAKFRHTYDANLSMSLNVIEACRALPNFKRLIFLGSCEEYGQASTPYIETNKEVPTSAYGLSKLSVTQILAGLFRSHQFPAIVLRPTVIYGPRQGDEMFLPALIQSLLMDKDFAMTAGGQQRDFVYIDDVVDAIVKAMDADPQVDGSVMNVGSGNSCSIKEVATLVAEQVGTNALSRIKFGAIEYRANEAMGYTVDINRAWELLQWRPKTSLGEGVRQTIQHFKSSVVLRSGQDRVMRKIHYHSDCPFFAGCENMLANFFNSEDLRKIYSISFSYRQSDSYTQGFRNRVKYDLPVYPVTFPNLSDLTILPNRLPLLCKRMIMAFLRLVLSCPVLLYEVIVLYCLFKKLDPDILHINNGGYPAALSSRAAAIAGKLAKIPNVVMVVNNMAADYRHYSRWMDYPFDRWVVRGVDLFITGSIAASNRIKAVLNLPSAQLFTIHNGIAMREATDSVAITRDRLGLGNFNGVVFGVVAILESRKGHQILLDAVLNLVRQNRVNDRNLKILIEGDGPLKQALVDFVKKHNLTQWVTFVGDEANIVDFMSALDVLILPSVQDEDFPNVILEAMALGKPVIASHLAGTPEQVMAGVTGLLTEPRNADQLADAICLLMERADLRSSMGSAGRDRFNAHFTSNTSLNNYMTVYQELSRVTQ